MTSQKILRILVLGHSHFVNMLAPMLSNESMIFQPFEGGRRLSWVPSLFRSDACYFIGGGWRDDRFQKFARFFHKPIVVHWVGTDVLMAGKAKEMGKVSDTVIRANINWAEISWTTKELEAIGVYAEIVPLTSSMVTSELAPLPQEFTVLAYLPSTRPIFYGGHYILRLAREMPDIRILCVGSEESPFHFTSEPLPSNIEFLGHPDSLEDVYLQTTVLIRVVEHDGLSFMVLEALAHGRYVIWSYPLDDAPGLSVAKNYEMMREQIDVLYKKNVRGDLMRNFEGAQFVRSHYAPEQIAEEIRGRFYRLINQ